MFAIRIIQFIKPTLGYIYIHKQIIVLTDLKILTVRLNFGNQILQFIYIYIYYSYYSNL